MLSHDVVIVGGGAAGLRAAIAVEQTDPSLSVGLVSKVYPMRSHTVAAEGGAAAVIRDDDSLDHHCADTIMGGDWLADQDAVEAFVEEAPAELIQLEHWGCPWNRDPSGHVAVRPFGGMTAERTWYAADKTGFHLLHTLFQTSLKYRHITRYDEWFATRLLIADDRCCGILALEQRTGVVRAVLARAVILCTGGAGRVFPFTTNGAVKTGDGMALAYRAGVGLKDMEFIQYHPTGLPGTGILITEAARGEGGILVNRDGYRYLQDYDLGTPLELDDPGHPQKKSMELGPRDRLSQAFVEEQRKGRTVDGPDGDFVHLDIRHLGEKRITKKIPFVRELAKTYAGIDPVAEPIPVRPVVHYMMGGVDTDVRGATSIGGLFAAGETACVSINGANRLGSNSLTECLVFGARAGRAAAEYAVEASRPADAELRRQEADEQGRIARMIRNSDGPERISALRARMREAMESGAGIYRSEEGLRESGETLAELRERFGRIGLEDRSLSHNTQLTAALELDFMLDVAESIVHSALARTESRGSHQRTDWPTRDNETFLKHSVAFREDRGVRVEHREVVITRWTPGERVYGKLGV